jgi:GntR family transcriptional regulator / MocR family aminotransferase
VSRQVVRSRLPFVNLANDHFANAPLVRISSGPEALPHVRVERGSDVPIYRQVYEGLRRAIIDGLLRAGQRVPSTRELATDLGVSRLSVLTAFDQLRHEGYLSGHVGSGTFVSAVLPDDALRSTRLRPGASAPRETKTARVAPRRRDEGGLRPFRMSLPALDHFPNQAWSRLVARRARSLSPTQMAYGDPAGLAALRSAVAEHLRTSRAVRCEADQVIIVSGSQAALRIAAAVILERGDVVAVEEPGYYGARSALQAAGADLAPVVVDDDGIDVSALHALGKRVRAVYVTPSHQYPLGVSMTASRRLALLDWANRTGAWILEDDYDSEYRYVSRPLGALQGMDAHDRVIYVGTFSKVMFPSLRVGYLIAPPSLLENLYDAREAFDVFPSTLYQLALADFIREGHFARHLRRMRVLYESRRDALLDGLDRYCADYLRVHNADAGLHLVTLLLPGTDDRAVIKRMAEHKLTAMALSTLYITSPAQPGLLLGFGGFDERRINSATRQLGEILSTML